MYNLNAPIAPVAPGVLIEVQLAALNRDSGNVAAVFPATLTAQLRSATEQARVELRAKDNAVPTQRGVAAGSFAVRSYTLEISPSAAPGLMTLDVSPADAAVVRSALEIDDPAPSPPRNASTGGTHCTRFLARSPGFCTMSGE